MLLLSHKLEQPNFCEAIKGLYKAWQPSNGIAIKTLMRKNHVLIV